MLDVKEISMNAYTQDFYENRHENTIYAANTVLSILLERLPKIDSVVDIGCGVGTWLSVLHEKGVKNIQGIDGNWVDQNLLVIPKTCFKQIDLSKTVCLEKKYDMAISLEVAEHLPPDRAEKFVYSLTELSDFVLFSAAIPFQGGVNHINEQWPHYWVKLFGTFDYIVYDFIRPKIWNDNRIPVWYRQNILFFSKRQKAKDVRTYPIDIDDWFMRINVVHPDIYLNTAQFGVKKSFRLLCQSLRNAIIRRFSSTLSR
jgi:hypothetical protein